MVESQAQPQTFLMSLFRRVKTFESDFPSPGDLQGLGIQTFEVSFDTNEYGTLKFDPCFFQPHPDKLLEKYLIHPKVDQEHYENHLKIPHIRTIQDFINDSNGISPQSCSST
ncbi:hypothetical protein PEX1_058190 [Penicillium expansum]|uniref:Uncharacterized protein n=1 Tax=Penicillium expansum TaxID=27334 RepID=A0A0A2JAI0_PENEN|nr:hypothetical protein PEX2_109960 [Penicillium expansum]KGO43174.1 hypothetical protein PEXP_029210 [Penicillium expansum]KGO52354.1 hypothetical protein PEX2_109960 [Penicillium expansum]KGO72597.1 hypothetical protein PEX1_058190 [Penicillium expansum]